MEYHVYANGDKMPVIGIGTWQSDPQKLFDAVVAAVEYGYRHIDCAYIYQNEKIVGEAIRDLIARGVVKREDLWITSKLWNACHERAQAVPALEGTLRDLGLDYLDMYLIHWPVAFRPGVKFPEGPEDIVSLHELPLIQTWRGMEECYQKGLTRHIGVSNFSVNKLADLLEKADVKPENNQIELNPYLQQKVLVDYCRKHGICVTAFSPLGKGNTARQNDLNLFEDPVVKQIAAAHDCPVSHVLLKWAIQQGIVVIPKSVTPSRIRENFDCLKVVLTDEEMNRLAAVDKHNRISYGGLWLIEGSPYTYENLWDEPAPEKR